MPQTDRDREDANGDAKKDVPGDQELENAPPVEKGRLTTKRQSQAPAKDDKPSED